MWIFRFREKLDIFVRQSQAQAERECGGGGGENLQARYKYRHVRRKKECIEKWRHYRRLVSMHCWGRRSFLRTFTARISSTMCCRRLRRLPSWKVNMTWSFLHPDCHKNRHKLMIIRLFLLLCDYNNGEATVAAARVFLFLCRCRSSIANTQYQIRVHAHLHCIIYMQVRTNFYMWQKNMDEKAASAWYYAHMIQIKPHSLSSSVYLHMRIIQCSIHTIFTSHFLDTIQFSRSLC